MKKCPFCGSKKIRMDLDAIVHNGSVALRPGPNGTVEFEWVGEPFGWSDMNHAEVHFCESCTAEFDEYDSKGEA